MRNHVSEGAFREGLTQKQRALFDEFKKLEEKRLLGVTGADSLKKELIAQYDLTIYNFNKDIETILKARQKLKAERDRLKKLSAKSVEDLVYSDPQLANTIVTLRNRIHGGESEITGKKEGENINEKID